MSQLFALGSQSIGAPYVGCVDSHTVVSLQEPRMFLRDKAHKSSPTECSPVHVVSPSLFQWSGMDVTVGL